MHDAGPRHAEPEQVQPPHPEHHHAPAIKAKGLEAPSGPKHLSYSAPSVDGDASAVTSSDSIDDTPIVVDPDANRAERRRAERANRKRKR